VKMGQRRIQTTGPIYSFGRVSRSEFKALTAKQKERKEKRRVKRKQVFERPLKVTRKMAIAKADQACGDWIKGRDKKRGCPFHGTCSWRAGDTWYHLIPRSKILLKWHPLNVLASCGPHNNAERL